MSNHDADRHIRTGIAGVYRFDTAQYAQISDFLSAFRRYEGLCRARGYEFAPYLSAAEDLPFDRFEITIQAKGYTPPFFAESRKAKSRKLTRL